MSAAVQTLEAGLVLAVERIAKLEAPASNVVDLVADFFDARQPEPEIDHG